MFRKESEEAFSYLIKPLVHAIMILVYFLYKQIFLINVFFHHVQLTNADNGKAYKTNDHVNMCKPSWMLGKHPYSRLCVSHSHFVLSLPWATAALTIKRTQAEGIYRFSLQNILGGILMRQDLFTLTNCARFNWLAVQRDVG